MRLQQVGAVPTDAQLYARPSSPYRSARSVVHLGGGGGRGAPRPPQQAWNPFGRKRSERPPSVRRGAPRPPSAPAFRLGSAPTGPQ